MEYARDLLVRAGGMEAAQAARVAGVCQECKRSRDAERAASSVRTGASAGLAANQSEVTESSRGREYLGGHGWNPEAVDGSLNDVKEGE